MLGRACTEHTEHLAHFNLRVEQGNSNQGGRPTDLKFTLAFRHISLVGAGQADPLWFVVDSILHEPSTNVLSHRDHGDSDGISVSLKRQGEPLMSCSLKPAAKRVRFQADSNTTQRPLPSVPFSENLVSAPTMRRDFCDYLRKYVCPSPIGTTNCMLLEGGIGCKHLVYPLPSMLDRTDKNGVSLENFLISISRDIGLGVFPQYKRLYLAKNLALAVLQYYATSWLKIAWRSQDILFFREQGDSLMNSVPNLSTPHLNVKVTEAGGRVSEGLQASRSLAPNPILFGLGVVLLEIAYSAPLKTLQRSCDLENGVENQYTEFFTARRLAKSIGREMGSSYGAIVKKLLQCDFGCGDDFNDRDLQAGYYRDVVCELDKLEQGFRHLQVG